MVRWSATALGLLLATTARADWIGSTFEDAMTDQKGATMVGRFYGEDGLPVIGIRCLDDASMYITVVTDRPYNDAAKYKPISIDLRVDKEKPMSWTAAPVSELNHVGYEADKDAKETKSKLVDVIRYLGGARERVVLNLPWHTYVMEGDVGETARIAQNMITTCHLPGGDIPVPEHQGPIPVAPAAHAEVAR